MALVRTIVATSDVRTAVHQPTHCEYAIVRPPEGGVYLQLDTFGSARRKCVGKVSQSIQLDHNAAKQLIEVIRNTFADLR